MLQRLDTILGDLSVLSIELCNWPYLHLIHLKSMHVLIKIHVQKRLSTMRNHLIQLSFFSSPLRLCSKQNQISDFVITHNCHSIEMSILSTWHSMTVQKSTCLSQVFPHHIIMFNHNRFGRMHLFGCARLSAQGNSMCQYSGPLGATFQSKSLIIFFVRNHN